MENLTSDLEMQNFRRVLHYLIRNFSRQELIANTNIRQHCYLCTKSFRSWSFYYEEELLGSPKQDTLLHFAIWCLSSHIYRVFCIACFEAFVICPTQQTIKILHEGWILRLRERAADYNFSDIIKNNHKFNTAIEKALNKLERLNANC